MAGFNDAFRIAGNVLKCIQPGTAGGGKDVPLLKFDTLNIGPVKPKSEQEQKTIFENAFKKGQSAVAGINTSLSKFEQNIGSWGIFGSEDGEARDPIECNTGNVFECGPPRVEFLVEMVKVLQVMLYLVTLLKTLWKKYKMLME